MTTDFRAIAASIADELSEHPERWAKGWIAFDSHGKACGSDSEVATSFCLAGHILNRVRQFAPSLETVDKFRQVSGISTSIGDWNDDQSRTVQDVIELCRKVAAS